MSFCIFNIPRLKIISRILPERTKNDCLPKKKKIFGARNIVLSKYGVIKLENHQEKNIIVP